MLRTWFKMHYTTHFKRSIQKPYKSKSTIKDGRKPLIQVHLKQNFQRIKKMKDQLLITKSTKKRKVLITKVKDKKLDKKKKETNLQTIQKKQHEKPKTRS